MDTTPTALAALLAQNWYYTCELAPGVVARGAYAEKAPYLPRMLMRNAALQGADCLDLGSMEGALAVLMHRGGARRVIATDAVPHCSERMEALARIYAAEFSFRQIGLMYDLDAKLAKEGPFDFVNLSGVLYHVMSPMHTLASVRPLVKPGGLFILSTNVVNEFGSAMHFNTAGELQTEVNTYWYPSIPLLDYLLRYFNFAPIDCLYQRHASTSPLHYVKGRECGYVSIVCRAVGTGQAMPAGDGWAVRSMTQSWEYPGLSRQAATAGLPPSTIGYRIPDVLAEQVARHGAVDVHLAVNESGRRVTQAETPQDSYLLQLGDQH